MQKIIILSDDEQIKEEDANSANMILRFPAKRGLPTVEFISTSCPERDECTIKKHLNKMMLCDEIYNLAEENWRFYR